MLPKRFNKARAASRLSDLRQHKIGAAVYYRGQFLAAGFNSTQTHPSTHWYDETFCRHAEIHALARAKARRFDLTNAIVMVYREKLTGELALAKPCQMCYDKATELGIKEVYYTCDGGFERMRL